jgi:hypothetical protein
MMMVAEEGASDRCLFNVPMSTPVQRNKKGMLISGHGAQHSQFSQPAAAEDCYNEGGLVQEVGIPKTPTSFLRTRPLPITPSTPSSNIGERMCSKVREMAIALRHNPSSVEALFAHISQMHDAILGSVSANLSPDNIANLVSFPSTDKRRVGSRWKSAGEPDRKRMKQTEIVELTMTSSRLDF